MHELIIGTIIISLMHAIIPSHWLPILTISKRIIGRILKRFVSPFTGTCTCNKHHINWRNVRYNGI
ncbi:MAG: hypothetical protein IPO85_13610 [Saprospiraceae bacterium]|uniref:Uncharacterized protein n=1 Tax=Candidatus Defluviibacterium haderslevense TaxID=2981993 RepID=A0A9D7SBT0_9BACT|nr:hypothetical protein [Candidatus Defluviibacterium haderslevense]